tara:strand:- start:87 stop:224 length:138 start_codon:yes stop_codon:yes gene_type:complete
MATKSKQQSATTYVSKSKKLYRHSKADSANKGSKHYKKVYKGQGK